MRRGVLAVSGACLLLAVLYVRMTVPYPRGTAAQPGPGLYPLFIGVLFVVACLGTALEAWGQRLGRGEDLWPQGPSRWRTAAILSVSLSYVILLPYLGHPVTGTLLMLTVFKLMGMARWFLCIGLAAAMGFGSQYLFRDVLGVPIPMGVWFE